MLQMKKKELNYCISSSADDDSERGCSFRVIAKRVLAKQFLWLLGNLFVKLCLSGKVCKLRSRQIVSLLSSLLICQPLGLFSNLMRY